MLSHENLASNARTLVDVWRFTAEDVLIHALPIYHTHGLFVAINTLLMAGGTMIFMPKFDADQVMAHMGRATSLMGVPTFYTRLIDHPDLSRETTGAYAALRVRLGAAARRNASRLFREDRPGDPRTLRHDRNQHEHVEPLRRRAHSRHGRLPAAGRRAARRRSRERRGLCRRARSASSRCAAPTSSRATGGCRKRPRPNSGPDGFFITGDLGKIDERGYVHIVGRGKDLVITGGFNVYPKEVETEIDSMPGVVESAVIGVPHPDFGEGVTAVVVKEKGAALSEAEIVTSLEARLAKFKQPKRVFFVDDLPRNTMGKVQKNVLREKFADIYAK